MKSNQKLIPPAEWPDGWLTAILSIVATLSHKYRFASQANYWRAYILTSRDTNWSLSAIMSLRFDQIAPDGTVVFFANDQPAPLVARLSKETLAAIEVLRQTPRQDGKIFKLEISLSAHESQWNRVTKAAGFTKAQKSCMAVFRTETAAKMFINARPNEPQTVYILSMRNKRELRLIIEQNLSVVPPLGYVTLDPVFAEGEFPLNTTPLDELMRFLEEGSAGEA